ncbi:hypothetical protein LUZ60_013217 [Juncus effusus]|nr:hypothetical protein LUZ60_013217 [Juncus effusus]
MRNNNKSGGFASNMLRWTSHKLSSLIPSSILPSSSDASGSDATIKDLKELESTMKRIQAIAMDAEQRGVKEEAEKLRLEELKDVAYDADDAVDEYEFEVLSAKIRAGIHLGGDNDKGKREDDVNHTVSSQLVVPVPSEIATKVKEIRERFNKIITEWDALRWGEGESHVRSDVGTVTQTESTSLVHEPSIHGRDKDKEILVEIIMSGDSDNNDAGSLSVIPLVGMGGIGKTTLAQLVYNDQRVCDYFQLRAWVCVSENFSLEIITRNIIVSFTNNACDFTVLNDLQRILANEAKGKRFLIVLDDVWNEKPSLWQSLKAPLVGTGFGTIIVTTRNENVARYMKTMDSYVLTYLPFEYCWSLFKQLAFECQDPNSNPDLLEIGRKIVEKCKGLPLAVKALGSLLRFEANEENWREILDSEIWELELRNSDILPALKISYDRLPIHLKQCFVFLSLFPKDYVIREDDIVSLWLSQGLVHPEGRKSVEDTCVYYVTELMQRSMIQPSGIQLSDGSKSFIMHDLVNALAQSVSGKDFSRIETDKLHEVSREVRYISVISNNRTDIIDLQYLNHLRAPRLLKVVSPVFTYDIYTYTSNCRMAVIPPELFQMLKHVRALDFSYSDINTLDDSIGKLKQLRYLNLRKTEIQKLPDSICGLYNLQTLDLKNCLFIEELPIRISSLVNLQHLRLESHVCIPSGIGQLLKLKTLLSFPVRPGSWHCALGELKNLVNLKGELSIMGLEYVTTAKDAEEASLCNKRYLNKLTLNWSDCAESSCHHSDQECLSIDTELMEQLLGALRPHANIEELVLDYYCGYSYPSWLGDVSFSKLVKFTLTGSYNMSSPSFPTLGQLPSLRDLFICYMPRIRVVGRDFCSQDSKNVAFRSLKTLEFKCLPSWVKWSGVENGDFCSLDTLRIDGCDRLEFIPKPLYSSLSILQLKDCRMLTTPHTHPSLNCLILSGDVGEVFSDGNLYLPLLKTLTIFRSPRISLVLNSRNLPSIEVIEISSCVNLENVVGLSNLNSLKELQLNYCPNLQLASDELLPHGVQRLTIIDCRQLHEWEQLQIRRN